MATTWVINSHELHRHRWKQEPRTCSQPWAAGALEAASPHLTQDLATFYTTLATTIGAGVRLDRALTLAGGEQLVWQIYAGKNLSEALAAFPDTFPRMHIQLLRVGEQTGALYKVLEMLADYERRGRELREQLKAALIYPSIVVALLVLALGLLPGWVLPPFQEALSVAGQKTPPLLEGVVSLSEIISSPLTWLGLIGLGFLLWRNLREWSSSLRILPGVGRLFERTAQVRLLNALALGCGAGLSLTKAIPLAAATCGCDRKVVLGAQAVKDLWQGSTLTQALAPLLPGNRAALSLVEAGEVAGQPDALLRRAASFTEDELTHDIERALTLVEPFVLLVAGLLVGGLVLTLLAPMSQLLQAL